ILLNKHIDA
nr:Chain C, Nucleoprotein [Severe acute respiratory syndrome coronavirus 2]